MSDNTGASEEYEEDRQSPCRRCGHGAPSHAVDDEERRECQRRMCECPQYEVMPACVTFAPHVERGIAGAKAWGASAPVDDTLAAIYIEAASRDRRCPECGNREINATETVCLACSNRAWGDR